MNFLTISYSQRNKVKRIIVLSKQRYNVYLYIHHQNKKKKTKTVTKKQNKQNIKLSNGTNYIRRNLGL